jgi:hypothetical protein
MQMAIVTVVPSRMDCDQVERIPTNLDGEGRYTFSSMPHASSKSETMYIGTWLNDKFHGQGQLYINGRIVYNGHWCEGMKAGKGDFYLENTTILSGEWQEDVPHGSGLLVNQARSL